MAKLTVLNQHVYSPKDKEVLLLSFRGLISTHTIDVFRDSLRKSIGVGCPVILDFSDLTYINSTGLGKLVSFFDKLHEHGQIGCLVCLNKESFKLVQMLGLHELLLIYGSISEGLTAIDDSGERLVEARRFVKGASSKRLFRISSAPPPRLPEARVLLGISASDSLSKLLARGLSGQQGHVVTVENVSQLRERISEGDHFDIAILDETLPQYKEICLALKTEQSGVLTSIIKVSSDISVGGSLCVCADEVIKEPFDLQELFALAQSEYGRTQLESILFVQEVALNFNSSQAGVDEAMAMLERLVGACGLEDVDGGKFIQAVSEGVDNAFGHGNNGEPFKVIKLLYVLDREKITVVIEDEGKGFDFKRRLDMIKNFTPLEQARMISFDENRGGLGINIMLKCCDAVEYTSPGNIVRLTKYI